MDRPTELSFSVLLTVDITLGYTRILPMVGYRQSLETRDEYPNEPNFSKGGCRPRLG